MRAGCSSFCWPFISHHAMRCRYIALLGSDAPLAKLVLRPCYLTHSLYCGPLPYIEAPRALHVCGQPVAYLQDGRPAAGSQHSSQHILPQHMQVERPPPGLRRYVWMCAHQYGVLLLHVAYSRHCADAAPIARLRWTARCVFLLGLPGLLDSTPKDTQP